MTDNITWPRKLGEIEHRVMDSTRWNDFVFRDDDIVIVTYPKSGTTLTQQIVAQLIFDGDPHVYGQALSPWIDFHLTPDAPARAAAQTHRRFLKTHLPLRNLVYSPKAKYLFIGRDPRDIAWSYHNHLTNFTEAALEAFAKASNAPRPPPDPDVRHYYHDFLDGPAQVPPYWAYIREWWDIRGLPNILFLHHAELIADLPGQIRRIATFLDIALDETALPAMAAHCSLAHMRKVAASDPGLNRIFRGGAETFINKGTNGRWRETLSAAEIEKCDLIAAGELPADCRAWLCRGTDCGANSSEVRHMSDRRRG
jgi:aryl sulfotransferase